MAYNAVMMMMVLLIVLMLNLHTNALFFSKHSSRMKVVVSHARTRYSARSKILHQSNTDSNSNTSGTVTTNNNDNSEHKKYECASCSFVFDEAKGYKKRYPAGTKFNELKTFACPICGAAINQFKLKDE